MQERKKKHILKEHILGVKIYICNLNLKPYMRPLDNRCANRKTESRRKIYENGGGQM